MTKKYSGKILFAGAIVVIALASRVAFPRLYEIAAGSFGDAVASSTDGTPQLIFPALSLATMPSVSSSSVYASSSDGLTAVTENFPMVVSSSGAITSFFVAPLGQVADSTFSRVGTATPPQVPVQISLIADLASGAPMMSQNAGERWPLASLTKLMTASIVLDDMSPDQKITITPQAFGVYPQELTLRVGDTYAVSDLLHFLLMPSSNVAAEALADAYGRTAFITDMNTRAAAWGMKNTHYVDPSGLAEGDQSTADDLVLLAKKIYAGYPQILAITRTPQFTATNLTTGAAVVVKSINAFAGEPDFIGGKTGYTDQADGNLLSIFSYDGHPVVVITLGTNDYMRFANMEQLYHWFTQNFKT